MNKNVKRIVALALAIGTVSAVAPATNFNLLTTRAYADDTDDNTDTTLDSLKLETSSGDTIKLYSDDDYKSDNKVDDSDVTDDSTYYAKTSSSTIDISTSGPKSKYVRVFKGTSSSTKGKKTSSSISLSSDTTTLTVRVYSSEPSSSVDYGDSYESQYKIKVKYTGSDSSTSSDSSNDYDDIYLDKLSIAGESISLSKTKTDYTYSVASDVDEVTVKAVPTDTDDTVTIDGKEVNEDDDKYKDDVSINKGENEIRVKVENDDNEERVYTLKVTRGSTAAATTATTATTAATTATATTAATDAGAIVTTAKPNQWVQINGGWQYNDSTGNPIKNIWFFDRNLGKWYYLGADGMMASNTTIGGWKVGYDGAWIK